MKIKLHRSRHIVTAFVMIHPMDIKFSNGETKLKKKRKK